MKILVDMNLSPSWCPILAGHGFLSVHWSTVGPANASDSEIMRWALQHDHVVLTHDLDFSAILAATAASGPSVVQVRTQDVMPIRLEPLLIRALTQFSDELQKGALIVIDEVRSRARVLPIRR